jgi:hypothetical protein
LSSSEALPLTVVISHSTFRAGLEA